LIVQFTWSRFQTHTNPIKMHVASIN